jgi:hypothetical protein
MNEVPRPFLRQFVLVFFDNILVYSSSWAEHLRHLHLVFTKLQEQNLVVKRSKCAFGERIVGYLGHIISKDGVAMDAAKVQAVLDWPQMRLRFRLSWTGRSLDRFEMCEGSWDSSAIIVASSKTMAQ